MKKTIILLLLSVIVAGCSLLEKKEVIPVTAPTPPTPLTATAKLQNSNGEDKGEVKFTQTESGVELTAKVKNMPEGTYAIHIHEVGKCEAPTFETAGAHFNPKHKEHGIDNPKGAHAGDLPNLQIGKEGTLEVRFVSKEFTLEKGKENSLLDKDGSAVVIHEKADDYKTDPSGNSGTRIVCGVVEQ